MTAPGVQFTRSVPVVPVLDAAEAIAFYAERFGATLAFEQGPYAGVLFGAVEVHLDGVANDGAGKVTVRIELTGVDDLFAELDGRGVVDPSEPIHTTPWGYRQFSALDHCGNRLTFVERSE